MGITASPFLNPTADQPNSVVPAPTTKALVRRARQRRQIQGSIGISYVVDAAILLVYAHAGTSSPQSLVLRILPSAVSSR